MNTPNHLREGQHMFNFLEWLLQEVKAPSGQNQRMADPFHLSNAEFMAYLDEYENELNN